MKPYCLLVSVVACTLLNAQAATYDKLLPTTINTGGMVDVTADCKYAPNNPGTAQNRQDCYVGYSDDGFQSFSHSGSEGLVIKAMLPADKQGQNIDIIFALSSLNVGGSTLLLTGFHGLTASSITLDDASLQVRLEDKKGFSTYGDTPVLVFRDDLYGQTSSRLVNGSFLRVENGDILLGKTQLFIDSTSTMEAAKANTGSGGTHNTPTIKNQAHITNYGFIKANTLKNGESITSISTGTGNQPPPGITNQNINGVIDNYGQIDVQTLENAAQGTINFHSLNGIMSSVNGTLTNTNGKINIYVAGARYGKHPFVKTGSTGLDSPNFVYENGASDFITASLTANKEEIEVKRNEDKITAFRRSFSGPEGEILGALDSRFNIYTYGGNGFVKNVVDDTQKGIYSGYLSAPLTMLESMKPKFDAYKTDLDLNILANGFFGSDLGLGGLGGLSINYGTTTDRYIAQYYLGYGFGNITQDNKNYDATTKGHIISLGAMNRFGLSDRLEVDTALYSLIGLFDSTQMLKVASANLTSPSSKSDFNVFNLGWDTNIGYRLNYGSLSMKPFAGVNQILSIRNKVEEKGGFNATIPSANLYMMYLTAGLENRLFFTNKKYLYAKLGYEYRLFNTKDIAINIDQARIIFTTPFTHKLTIDMGGEILVGSASLITLGVSYNSAIAQSVHYFGGNVAYRFRF